MFNRYLSILEELGVNPIVIPKNDTVPTKDRYIKKSFIRYFYLIYQKHRYCYKASMLPDIALGYNQSLLNN